MPLTHEQYVGVVITMITSTDNPGGKSFIHVNDIVHRTDDAVDLGHGRIFVPFNKQEQMQREKKYVIID